MSDPYSINYSTGTNYVTVQDFNTVAQKRPMEQSMFKVDVFEFYDGTFQGALWLEGKIVVTTEKMYRSREKAAKAAQKLKTGAVYRLFSDPE